MKLVRFEAAGRTAIGALTADGTQIVDLVKATGSDVSARFPSSMSAFLARGAAGVADAAEVVANAPAESILPLFGTRLLAPIGDPPKIICIGQNYRDHCLEQNQPIPPRAILFSKFTTAINHPNAVVTLPKAAENVDYEAELVVIVGGAGGGRDIPVSEAMNHVAGYMCANDVSARDLQMHPDEKQWLRGKSPDGFLPIGPYLVTADEIADPHNLDISLTLNGQTMQTSNTSNLIFNIPFLISHLSLTMTLLPGDIISTGTPGGVGAFRKPPVWLQPGDTVSVTIAGLGTLTNSIAR